MGVSENLRQLRESIPSGVELVAVSKFHPVEALLEAYETGQRVFGESRANELCDKVKVMPADVRWHFIGHLQTNKVKMLVGKTSLIESVDSERLLKLIDSESAKAGVVTNVLLQVHVAQEETKFGFYPEELLEYFRERRFETLTSTHICGIMGMASNTDVEDRIREDFHRISEIFHQVADDSALGLRGFDKLSMGMSGDWQIAVDEGANIVRIGTRIFGMRQY